MNKKKDAERQSLGLATAALVILIATSWPAEITVEKPMSIMAIICYVVTAIVLIVQWVRHFLKYRNSGD